MAYVLGVDLGTTYSAAATGDGERFEITHLGSQAATIPSVVFLRADGEMLTGESADRRASAEPARAGREFKRRLGDPAPLIIGGSPFSADALMALLLRAIVAQVSEERGGPPARIAITHPASYGEYRLELVRQVASQAGVVDPVFLPEPVAAALQYASQERVEPGAVIAVYDFGGGTFDAAVLRKTADGFEILGQPEGLERLGGIDFDEAVFNHVVETIGREALEGGGATGRAAVSRLREESRKAKESLSGDTEASIPVLLPTHQGEVRLTRAELEAIVRPRIRETVAALERSVASAGLRMADIDRILLVGGSSRIPLVAQTVREQTGRPVARDAHPKHAIAIGAARVAARSLAVPQPAVAVAQPPVDGAPPAGAAPPPALEAPVPPVLLVEPVGVVDSGHVDAQRLAPTPALALDPERAAGPALAGLRSPAAEQPSLPPKSPAVRRRSIPRWLLVAVAAVVIVAMAGSALVLSGALGGGARAAAAQITNASLDNGTLQVWFGTTNFTPTSTGERLVFYWNTSAPSDGVPYWGSSPASFQAQLPSGTTQICVAVLSASGDAQAASGNCWGVS